MGDRSKVTEGFTSRACQAGSGLLGYNGGHHQYRGGHQILRGSRIWLLGGYAHGETIPT